MYFALIWKTPLLSLAELELAHVKDIRSQGNAVFFSMDKKNEPLLDQLAWIMKWWIILPRTPRYDDLAPLHVYDEALNEILSDCKLVWTNDKTIGMRCKKVYGVKRFKQVDMEKADLDVKRGGVELIYFNEQLLGQVKWWQDIDRYAAIDFDKPERGMQIGMMPAKLTEILLNIGLIHLDIQEDHIPTIYDPFCGFGTTLFVANSLGYHAIWSDINASLAKKNISWWKEHEFANTDRFITHFKHDIHEPFTKPFLDHVDVIVTEWWLWPVIKKEQKTKHGEQMKELQKYIDEIVAVYRWFLVNTKEKFVGIPMVITVPVYDWLGDVIEQRISQYATQLWYTVEQVGEVYKRKTQVVGRRVLLLK